jgi:hypothetical protein
MDMGKVQRLSDMEAVATELAGEISNMVRADAFVRQERRQAGDGQTAVEDPSSLIRRISGTMLDEIDRVISALKSMQDMVRSESERVEREITNYASMGQAAMASTKIVADGLAQWLSPLPPVPHDMIKQEALPLGPLGLASNIEASPAQSEA